MVQDSHCRMYNIVVGQLAHTKKRMAEYWGKDRDLYRFYEAQNVNCRDLILQHKAQDEYDMWKHRKTTLAVEEDWM